MLLGARKPENAFNSEREKEGRLDFACAPKNLLIPFSNFYWENVMKEFVSESDFRSYCTKFESIFGKVLRPGVNFDALAIVSKEEGALVFFEFKKQPSSKLKYKVIDERIAAAVQELPQKGFAGDLSGVRFVGKNVIAERNRLIIIKGDNSRISWSPEEAVKDAVEEVNRIASLRTR